MDPEVGLISQDLVSTYKYSVSEKLTRQAHYSMLFFYTLSKYKSQFTHKSNLKPFNGP